jgi:hypothetical protein
MDFKDTVKLLIAFRITEMRRLLEGYTDALPDTGCEEVVADIERARDSLGAATSNLRIHELFSEDKK